ncbi:hypothetical protein [Kordiimonas marina]|uniref:hypothetical protein n=1 Tax=Kordiimonas marina TaxID=2872312 RepID=UPI001FF6ABFD|nr:hypothetical protein [Kordiimonas marina]MCJ9429561.1 hypothetical protein [Kordiimonas marina]
MSDIFGPPTPGKFGPLSGTNRASAVSKDPQHTPTQGGDEKGDTRSRTQEGEAVQARDPAVSISASAAHVQVGDKLHQNVDKIDTTGRPIIVTNKATFALRPDAGLKPGDDVILQITEAGKTVSAELLARNGHVLQPPEKLTLTVISIHTPEGSAGGQEQAVPAAPQNSGYQRGALPPTTAETTSETLASLLGRNTLPPSGQQAVQQVTDPLVQRASSSDLAALISAQQQGRAPQGLYKTSALVPPGAPQTPEAIAGNATAAPGHLLPASPLTEVPALAETAEAGLGATLPAFTPNGAQIQVQQLDASVSRVPPQQVAEVLQVRALAPEEARTLNLPVSAFAGGALAHVETSKGPIIMSYDAAAPLAGELVKISETAASTAQATPQPTTLYNARFTPPGGEQRAVQVALREQQAAQVADAGAARIKAVHTVRAFLTPEGPKTDFRLETTSGIISLTLPNGVRPTTGDLLDILPVPGKAPMAAQPEAALAAAAASGATAAAQGSLQALSTGWPALEAAQTLVASTAGPAASATFSNRGADGGAKLTNSLLFFLKAAGAGPESWLGEAATRVLAEKDAPLLEVLKRDISHMASLASHTGSQWRAAIMPLDMRHPDMPLVAVLFPGPEQQGTNPDGHGGQGGLTDAEKEQRFLVEVRFSLLGAIQMDGTIRDRQFDLTLRSEKQLSPALKTDAFKLFDAALGANGFTGRLSVNDGEAFPLQVDALLASSEG